MRLGHSCLGLSSLRPLCGPPRCILRADAAGSSTRCATFPYDSRWLNPSVQGVANVPCIHLLSPHWARGENSWGALRICSFLIYFTSPGGQILIATDCNPLTAGVIDATEAKGRVCRRV